MIYIQSNKEKTLPHHFDAACAMYGAIETGREYKLVSFEEVESGKYNSLIKQNLFVGSVEFMKEVFSKVGKENTKLPRNSNREYVTMTLGNAKTFVKDSGLKIFIKPFDIKLFTGFVLDEMVNMSIASIPDDTMVMAYKVFPDLVRTEYRCYIHRNKIADIRNYSGELFSFPDEKYIESVIESNKADFPISYTIDIGILENGENVVVEYNDMWAIGNYGIPNDLYLRLLRDRYFEIVK
jgi:hypothetical protein